MRASPPSAASSRRKRVGSGGENSDDAVSSSDSQASSNLEGGRQGDLPPGWTRLAMADVGRWSGGGTPSKAKPRFWANGTIPWVSPKDMKSDVIEDTQDHITEDAVRESSTNLTESGSVLVVVRSGILQHTLPVAVARRQVALNQDLKAVKPREGIRPDYLAFALKTFEHEILHICTKTGTTVQSLEMPLLLRYQIPIAPPAEQRRVVEEIEKQFTRLDAAVAALRRVQTGLKRYRASVLKAACEGRLVPTEAEIAKTTPQGPRFESGEDLLTRILSERRRNWNGRSRYREPAAPVDGATLPPSPNGWTWASVEQVSTKVVDGVHKKPVYVASGIPFVTVRNLTAGPGISFKKLNYIAAEDHADFIKRANPERGDILISKDGTLGVIRVVETDVAFSIFVSVAMIKPVMRDMSHFLGIALSSPTVQAQMVPEGSGLQHIHLEDLRQDCIPLPPLAEQLRIVAEVERRLSVVEELESVVSANLQRATRLRQSILQKAFAGELV
jgi:type I restriction enzyme, S subunit